MTQPTDPRPTADPARAQGRQREPGYRGSLPTREDRLAKPWILTIIGIFLLVMALSIAGVPSRFIPDPTPIPTLPPLPSASASASAEPSSSASDSAEPSATGSEEPSPSASATEEEPSASASAEPSSEASPSP